VKKEVQERVPRKRAAFLKAKKGKNGGFCREGGERQKTPFLKNKGGPLYMGRKSENPRPLREEGGSFRPTASAWEKGKKHGNSLYKEKRESFSKGGKKEGGRPKKKEIQKKNAQGGEEWPPQGEKKKKGISESPTKPCRQESCR